MEGPEAARGLALEVLRRFEDAVHVTRVTLCRILEAISHLFWMNNMVFSC